jgi:hypothetical protein
MLRQDLRHSVPTFGASDEELNDTAAPAPVAEHREERVDSIDRFAVIRDEDGSPIALEGNRRVAARKMFPFCGM